jgi:succinate-semialdehyde dehydrogenase/glutarate-semialdehyde dehydrogenase
LRNRRAGVGSHWFLTTDWRPAATGATFDVFDPSTEQPIAAVADCGPADALAALDAAADAAPTWGQSTLRERADCHGHYAAPTVLDHVPANADILREEVFGPVAAIRRRPSVA